MIHQVFANRSNVGDWLSARGIQALLGPGSYAEHLCDEPFVPATLEALGALGPDDRVVIGGGGLLMDYFEPFWEGFREVARTVPFAVWGVGFVDLKQEPSRASRSLLEEVLGQARVCRVRDELTRSLLPGLRLPPPCPCPSLAVVPPATGPGHGVLHAANLTTVGEAAYEAMRREGLAFAGETGTAYLETDNRIRSGDEPALEEAVRTYAGAERVLSSRLHGCILALAVGRPVLTVSGDRKIEAFMEAAGLADWVLDQADLAPLPALLRDLPSQPSARSFVKTAVAVHRDVAREVREALR